MSKAEELNEKWIEACKVMNIIDKQRILVYKEWKAHLESLGHVFEEEGLPIQQEFYPSFKYDLYLKEIDFEE